LNKNLYIEFLGIIFAENCMKIMGKLIILSGPSGVGKGPFADVVECFMKAKGKTFHKHVIYNTRKWKKGEKHGQTYLYTQLMQFDKSQWDQIKYTCADPKENIKEAKASLDGKEIEYNKDKAKQALDNIAQETANLYSFELKEGGDGQGINLSVLAKELKDKDLVLLEIYEGAVPAVVDFCTEKRLQYHWIFLSPIPLSDEDFNENEIYQTMRQKIVNRGREKDESDIDERAKRAVGELKNARARINEENFHIIVNHFGEDMKDLWDQLKEIVSTPDKLEIVNIFLKFVHITGLTPGLFTELEDFYKMKTITERNENKSM